jgi:hypothetical protein
MENFSTDAGRGCMFIRLTIVVESGINGGSPVLVSVFLS